MIFRHLPYIQTLSALVHASPAYHAVYAAFREQIFTRFTILELQKRRINVLTSGSFLEVNTIDNTVPNPLVKVAILACHDAVGARKIGRLPIDQCLALLTIRDLVGWSVKIHHEDGIIAVVQSSHHARSWVESVLPRQQTPMDIHRSRKKYRHPLKDYYFLDLDFDVYPRLKPLYPRHPWKLHVLLEMGGASDSQALK